MIFMMEQYFKKTYIFLTNDIGNMGGSQMLLRNRIIDLKSRGWCVHVFYYFKCDIVLIPELREYFGNNLIPELQNDFFFYSSKKINDVVNRIDSIVRSYDDVVIESNCYHLGFWGEIIAKKLRGISILYFITEDFKRLSGLEKLFILNKQRNGEWVNSYSIKKKYVSDLSFQKCKNDYIKMPDYSNVLSEEVYELNYDKQYPVILSIGRLEKPYIIPMIEEIIKFADSNQVKVNLFFVGSSPFEVCIQKIKKLLSKTDLVIPYWFGFLYPIPKNIIKSASVSIASSGSVKVSTSLNIPTISICAEDNKPLGIYGYTTNSTLLRTDEPILPLSNILEDVIMKNMYKDNDKLNCSTNIIEDCYEANNNLILSLLNQKRQYFNPYSYFPIYKRVFYNTFCMAKDFLRNIKKMLKI